MSDYARDLISETYETVERQSHSERPSSMRSAQMSLFANITSYPPLGEVTCVKRSERLSDQHEVDKVSLFLSMSQRSLDSLISESRSIRRSVYANSDSSRFGS